VEIVSPHRRQGRREVAHRRGFRKPVPTLLLEHRGRKFRVFRNLVANRS